MGKRNSGAGGFFRDVNCKWEDVDFEKSSCLSAAVSKRYK